MNMDNQHGDLKTVNVKDLETEDKDMADHNVDFQDGRSDHGDLNFVNDNDLNTTETNIETGSDGGILSEEMVVEQLNPFGWSDQFIDKSGNYYGYVASVKDAEILIKTFELTTSTRYVVKKTDKKNFGESELNLNDKHKVLWEFDVPYIVLNSKCLECQHGKDHHYTKKLKYKKELDHLSYMSPSLKMRNTKKLGCTAQIRIRELVTFPEFKIPRNTSFFRGEYATRLKKKLSAGEIVAQVKRISLNLPEDNEHLEHVSSDKLKAALHFNVGKLCENEAQKLNVAFSKKFIAALTETTWKQCGIFAEDLELFARHAKRTTITPDDVKLLARRSPSVSKHLNNMAEDMASKGAKKKSKKLKLDTEVEKAIEVIDS